MAEVIELLSRPELAAGRLDDDTTLMLAEALFQEKDDDRARVLFSELTTGPAGANRPGSGWPSSNCAETTHKPRLACSGNWPKKEKTPVDRTRPRGSSVLHLKPL